MKARTELLVYTILIILAGGLSLLLVTDILQAKAERVKFSESEVEVLKGGEVVSTEPTPLQTAVAVFNDRSELFSDLVTPKPTPTQPILPTPTQTPIPLINEHWKIGVITAKVVQLTTVEGTWTYREGDTVPKGKRTGADIVVYKIDKPNERVFLWRKTDNVMGWFLKKGGVEYCKDLPK